MNIPIKFYLRIAQISLFVFIKYNIVDCNREYYTHNKAHSGHPLVSVNVQRLHYYYFFIFYDSLILLKLRKILFCDLLFAHF